MLNFKKERINIKQVLGRGAFGVVRPYQKNPSDQKWAVKIIKAYTFEDLQQCFKEISLGFSCDNPYVLPVRGYLIEQDNAMGDWNVYIKLPRMSNGSLQDVLNDHKKSKSLIPEMEIAQYFYEMVCGLQYLHKRNIAHRDIKPENILFDENKTIKIADFGIGDLNDGNTTYALAEKAGAMCYAAPENRDMDFNLQKKDLFATDLWSLGMVLFELCTLIELKHLVLSHSGEKLEGVLKEKLQELEREGKYSKTLISLICSLLRLKSTERRSLRDTCEELIGNYGTQLKMNNQTKGAQTDSSDWNQGLTARLQELEKKLEERDAYIERMEKYHKGIVDELEGELKKLQGIKLGLSDKEAKIKDADREVEKFEGKSLDQEEMKKSGQQIKLFMEEFEKNYKGIFKIKNVEEDGMGDLITPINFSSLNDENVKELAKQVGTNLKTLQHLSLDLSGCRKITDESVKEMAIQIGTNLKTLQHLTLNLSCCDEITDECMKGMAIQIGTNLKTLQHLSLDLSGCGQITDEGVKEMAIHIGTNLKTLQHLTINLAGCDKITDEGVKEMAIQIGTNLKTLQHLTLNLSCCRKITDESVKEMAIHIGTNLKTLQHLTINLAGCDKITDESVKEMAIQIGTNLKTLQHLALDLTDCFKITDEGLKEMALQIGTNLKTLQHLTLNLTDCRQITDEGVKEMAIQIGTNLKTLQHLTLNLTYCDEITDESVKEMAIQIGTHLKTLQHLTLNLTYCRQITNEGMKGMALQIGTNLKTLQHLTLNLIDCDKITDEGVKEMAIQIGTNLKTLQQLRLNFFNTSVSEPVKDSIRSQFKHLSVVDIR